MKWGSHWVGWWSLATEICTLDAVACRSPDAYEETGKLA